MFGVVKFYHLLPGFTEPFVSHYKEDGKLLSIRKPYTQSPSILYRYDERTQKLKNIVSGDSETSFEYDSNRIGNSESWSKEIDHKTDDDFKINTKFVMNYAAAKESKILQGRSEASEIFNQSTTSTGELRVTFNPVSGYASAKFAYRYF